MCCTSESRKRILVQLSLAVREAERSNSQQAGQSFTGLIRESDMAVTYITHSWGGAAQFAELAGKKMKRVINIASMMNTKN